MARAALVQGWNRLNSKRGTSALGSLQPSGSLYAGDANAGNIGVAVEVYQGDIGWVDVTNYTQYRDGAAKINISRGRPDEASRYQPQTATVMLNNRDSRFSPRNPTGPYYGLIGRNTPIRISRMHDGTRWYRYCGEVPSWPSNADVSNTDVYTQITAYGQTRRFSQGNTPIGSAMRRNMVDPFRKYSNFIVGYWPLEDSSGATQFASGIFGTSPAYFTSGVSPAADSSYLASDPLPTVTTGTITCPVPTYTNSFGAMFARWYAKVPSGGVSSTQHMISFLCTGGTVAKFSVMLDSSGDLWLFAYNSSGVELTGNGPVAFAVNGAGYSIGLQLTQSGSDISATLITFRTDSNNGNLFNGGLTLGAAWTWTLTGQTLGVVGTVKFGEDGGMAGTTVGHIAVANSSAAFTSTGPAILGNQGEPPMDRIVRLSRDNLVNFAPKSDPAENKFLVTMGNQPSKTYLSLVQEAIDSGLHLLYEPRDQLGLAARSRASLYNQGTVYNTVGNTVVLDYSQNQLSQQPVPKDDDYYTRNNWTVNRINGSSSNAVLTSGTLSTSPPPDGVGEYDTSSSFSLYDDSQNVDQAGWRLHMGTVDEPRFPQVSVNLRHQQFQNNPSLASQIMSLDIGDVIEIDNPPSWISTDPIRMIIQGYQESLGAFEHDMVFNCSPESPYRVAVSDDWVLSRADTAGSTLSNDFSSTDTLLSFATTDPLADQWTFQPQDFPFDVNIGGERITVISPGTSRVRDPYLSAGLTHFSGQGGAISLDSTRPFPTGLDGVLEPFALQTILMIPTGGTTSDVLTDNSGAGTIGVGSSYTAWGWVYNPNGRNMKCFINWADSSGTYLSTSFGTDTVIPAGVWTLVTAVATAPASTSQLSVGVVDSGTPTAAQTYNCWGLGCTRTTNLAATPGVAQNFTVVRSVNGVVKAQSSGTDIRLWQPMIVAL